MQGLKSPSRWNHAGRSEVNSHAFYSSSKGYNQNWLHLRKQIQNISLTEGENYPQNYVKQTLKRLEMLTVEEANESKIYGRTSKNC